MELVDTLPWGGSGVKLCEFESRRRYQTGVLLLVRKLQDQLVKICNCYLELRIGTLLNLEAYFPVLLFILVGIGVGLAPMGLGKLLGANKPDAEKISPYECGFDAYEDARMKFDVRYYLIAILFILFDLETAFLFPWGVALSEIGWTGYISMLIFLLEFVIGFAYIWKKGALNWE